MEEKLINYVECRGSAYEIGGQWGKGCRQSIRSTLIFHEMIMKTIFHASKQDVIDRSRTYLDLVREFDPYLIEIIQGQADGSGISFEEVFSLRCMWEFSFYYHMVPAMCTSFAATGRAAEGGRTILGQTLDWAVGVPLDILRIQHQDGLEQLTVWLAASSEYSLSSRGLGMCANATINNRFKLGIPLACYLPRMMRMKNTEEAIQLLARVATGVAYYHLADAEGNICGIESSAEDHEIIRPQGDLLVHSNHYLTDRFQEGDIWPSFMPSSQFRLKRMTELLNRSYGSINPEIAMAAMRDHENYPYSVCQHPDPASPSPGTTLGSFIMLPAEGVLYLGIGNPCQSEYVKYQLTGMQ